MVMLNIKLFTKSAVFESSSAISICPCAEKHWESSPLWAEDNRPQLNPHKFGYILNEPKYCGVGEVVDLLILVASAVGHRDNRDAIRATWDETQNPFNSRLD